MNAARNRTPRRTVKRRKWARHLWRKSDHTSGETLRQLISSGFASKVTVYGQMTRILL
jgi:hypothetical protein